MNLFKIASKFSTTKPLATIEEGVIYPVINFLTGEITQYPEKYVRLLFFNEIIRLKEQKRCSDSKKCKSIWLLQTKLKISYKSRKKQMKWALQSLKKYHIQNIFIIRSYFSVSLRILNSRGRSNVGKSTILNKLVSKKVGNVSKTPVDYFSQNLKFRAQQNCLLFTRFTREKHS